MIKGGDMEKKKKFVFLGLIVVALGIGFYFTPHFAGFIRRCGLLLPWKLGLRITFGESKISFL